jgi:hypothetical protein
LEGLKGRNFIIAFVLKMMDDTPKKETFEKIFSKGTNGPQKEMGTPIDSLFSSLNDSHSDIILRLDNGQCFNAHKCILAARSDYFRNLFSKEV